MAPIYEFNDEQSQAIDLLGLGKRRYDLEQKESIVKSDYIKLGIKNIEKKFEESKGFGIAIAPSELNKNWEEQNISLLEKGLSMSNIKKYMIFHNSIIDSYQNKTPLFDARGNEISRKVIKDLYNQITSDEWVNLNAKFDKDESGIWLMNQAESLDANKNIIYNSKQIKIPIQEDCYVNFKSINEEGFPTGKFKKQEFQRGKNIYQITPRKGAVARFVAGSGGASLGCGRDSSGRDPDLGVRAVVAGQ